MKNNITAANSARFFPLIHTHRRSEFMLRTIHFFYLVPLSGESDSLFVRLREWDKCDGNTRNKKTNKHGRTKEDRIIRSSYGESAHFNGVGDFLPGFVFLIHKIICRL